MDQNQVFGDVLHAYTRAQALADGVLVDCTIPARDAGVRIPVNPGAGSVAMTCGAFSATVRASAGLLDLVGVFAALRLAINARPLRPHDQRGQTDRIDFAVPGADGGSVDLYAHCGPGDDPRPVITVMLSDED